MTQGEGGVWVRLSSAALALAVLGAIATGWAGDHMPTITAKALEQRMMAGSPPLVLDIRGSAAHLAGTIPNAVNAGTDPLGFLPDGRPGEAVLLMAPASDLESARPWYERLTSFQLSVAILDGGLAAWISRGLPVEVPSASYIKPGQVPFTIPRGLCEMNTPAREFD